MAGKFVDVTLRLIDKMSGPLNTIGGKLANSAQQWTRAGRQIEKTGKSISAVGSSMTKSVTLPIVGAGTACVKLASDFEAGMSKVQSIAGLSGNEMDKLSQKAKQMGAKTKFSAKEATQAYEYMAMAGWKAGDMLNGIEGVMYLAGATGEDLASVSDIVTDGLTAFGMSAKDTEKFVNVLAKTASNSNTNVAMLGESFQYAAPVAGALGYNVQDVSTALGLMANSGIKASSAGTSLRSWMSRMSAPTDAVANAMSKLGISMTDSKGNMKDFKTLMEDTRRGFSKLSETQKAQYASTLAGKTGMSGLLAIVNSSDKDFDKLSKSIYKSNGACKEMYKVANNNLQGQLTILKSTVQSLAISFGERLAPYVKKLTSFVQKLAERFNGLSDKQKDMIIKIALVAAAIGPAILMFGKMVTGVGKVVSVVGKVGKAFKTFGSIAGIITSPVGIVIGVLAGVALAAVLIIKNWSKVKGFLQNVKKWFLDAFSGTNGALSKFKESISIVVSTAVPILQKLAKMFSNMLPKAISFLIGVFNKIKPVIEKAVIIYVNLAAKYVLFLAKAFQKIVPVVINFTKNAIQKMTPGIRTLIKVFKEIVPIIKNALVKSFNILLPLIKTVIKVVKSLASTILKNLGQAFNAARPVIIKLGGLVGVIFTNMASRVKWFWGFIKPVVKGIINTLLSIAEFLRPAFQVAANVVGAVLKGLFNRMTIIFKGIMGVLGGLIDFVTGVFTGNWKKAWTGVKNVLVSIFSTFAGIVKQPINAVIGLVNKAIGSLNKVKVDIPDWVPKMGGKKFGINIPTIPKLAVGTDNWKGGIVQISEKGGEIVDLPKGSRVYPHDKSVQKAYNDGAKRGRSGNITITIPKLADSIIVREDADIDEIVNKLADKLEKVSLNLGGGDIGYSY